MTGVKDVLEDTEDANDLRSSYYGPNRHSPHSRDVARDKQLVITGHTEGRQITDVAEEKIQEGTPTTPGTLGDTEELGTLTTPGAGKGLKAQTASLLSRAKTGHNRA